MQIINSMHELSIAMDIVRIAEGETAKVNAEKVLKIEREIGVLSGIEIDALNFVWSAAVQKSVLANAVKEIIVIQGVGKCEDCGNIFDMKNIYDCCPKCGSNFKNILKGKELKVKTLEVI